MVRFYFKKVCRLTPCRPHSRTQMSKCQSKLQRTGTLPADIVDYCTNWFGERNYNCSEIKSSWLNEQRQMGILRLDQLRTSSSSRPWWTSSMFPYLSDKRVLCRQTGHSRRWSRCTSPRSVRHFGTGLHSCCSVPGNQASPRVWS